MAGAFEATAARAAAALEPARRALLVADLRSIASGPGESRRSRSPDLPAPPALDERFHRALANAGAGPHLQRELDVLYPQAARYARADGPRSRRHRASPRRR